MEPNLQIALFVVATILAIAACWPRVRWMVGLDRFSIEKARPVSTRADGLSYRVHLGHPEAQHAAELMAVLNSHIIDLLRYLRTKYDGCATATARCTAVARLLQRYNPDHLAENSPNDPTGDTSFSQNKGELIGMCLRRRTDAQLHEPGLLMFVAIHELAHIAMDEIDHPPTFWRTFKFLLEEAERANLYYSPDFARQPAVYCGVRINYNPRWDPSVAAI